MSYTEQIISSNSYTEVSVPRNNRFGSGTFGQYLYGEGYGLESVTSSTFTNKTISSNTYTKQSVSSNTYTDL